MAKRKDLLTVREKKKAKFFTYNLKTGEIIVYSNATLQKNYDWENDVIFKGTALEAKGQKWMSVFTNKPSLILDKGILLKTK